MKNKTVFIMVLVLILIILLIALSGRGLKTISGYVVKKSNENNPLSFYIVLGALILIAAVLSYIYGVKKFGPA